MFESRVVKNPELVEYGKFVEIKNDARFPAISVTRVSYPDQSNAFPNNAGLPPLTSVEVYPKYGVITYLANASDINLVLSASEVDIGNVGLVDHYTTGFDTYTSVIYTNTAPGGQLMGAVSVKPYGTTPVWVTNNTMGVSGSISANITNTVAISTTQTVSVSVVNSQIEISNDAGNPVPINTTQTLPISGSVTVLNPVSTVNVTGSVATNFNPTQVDAFNRLRVSNPLTLFDSSHRFRDNNLWSTLSAGGGSVAFNSTQGLMELNVTNAAGASALRETTKVFAWLTRQILACDEHVCNGSFGYRVGAKGRLLWKRKWHLFSNGR